MELQIFKYTFEETTSRDIKKIIDIQEINHAIKVLTPPQSFLTTYEQILETIPDDEYILCPLSINNEDVAGISLGVKGKMKRCENFLDTAARELKEEVGLGVLNYQKPIMNISKRDNTAQCAVFYATKDCNIYNPDYADFKINYSGDIKTQKVCVLIHGSSKQIYKVMSEVPRYLINDGENIIGFSLVPKQLFSRYIQKFKELFVKYLMSNFYCIFYDKTSDNIYEQMEDFVKTNKYNNCIYTLLPDGNAVINNKLHRLHYWNTTRLRRHRSSRNTQDYNQNQLQSA